MSASGPGWKNPESFTADKVPEFTAKCQEYQEQKEAAKDEDASKPDSLKKLVNWALWNESFQNYLRQILSAAKIPLVYLTRDEREAPENVLDPADFGSPMDGAWRSQAAEQFQACQQYLSTTVENRATLERSERNISGVKSGEKTDKTAKAGKLPKGFKLENKYYPPKIFRLLSQEQKDQLKEWGDKKGKRSVAALKKQIKEELKNEMKKLARETTMMAMMTMSQAQMKRPGRNSVAAHKKKQKLDKA
ncbi:hypothetical protein MHU86_15182 [Fragilaria crotonensis]|nr:hypothetical protein MHU86_15182 [Fragilaria crotonensis]